jgi:hypothetical protein
MDWKVNVGVAVLGLVLALSIAAVLAFHILPLLLGTKRRRGMNPALLYFVASVLDISWWKSPSSSALCCFWDIDLCPHCSHFSDVTVQRRRKPVLPQVAE